MPEVINSRLSQQLSQAVCTGLAIVYVKSSTAVCLNEPPKPSILYFIEYLFRVKDSSIFSTQDEARLARGLLHYLT